MRCSQLAPMFRVAASAAIAVLSVALSGPAHAQAPAPAAPAADASPTERWGQELWDAARRGESAKVDALLAKVPDAGSADASRRLRESVAAREAHVAETQRKVAEQRAAKAKELDEAVAAGSTVKALVAAAYLKFLSEDWQRDLRTPGVRSAVALADRTIDKARADGDWLYVEELLNRVRSLYEGSGLRDEYQKYDDALETDASRRVMLVLNYAPRAWYELRKLQYGRLDEKDRKEPFPAFNEKGADDWKQALEGINEGILQESLSRIAGEHLENVGWKPLIEGGLSMVKLLGTTAALKENFATVGDGKLSGAFAAAVADQMTAVSAMKAGDVDAGTFRKVMQALRAANDATLKLPVEVLVREFGDGAIATMTHDFEDPYTEIVWPDRLRRFNQMIKGKFVGVGILIRHNEKREIVIINPLDGSPAKRAGIKPNDKIVGVNGESTADWPLDKAVDTITGPAGTTVKLSVVREGEEGPLSYPLVRESIKMFSVQGWRKTGYNERLEPMWDWFVDQDARIGYVRLTGFNEDTFADFLKAVRDMASSGDLRGLVLDLRGNPGGLLQSAVSFVNAFLKSGRIVAVEDRNGQEQYAFNAQRNRAPLADIPTVVLINEGSASASEIVSGALEAHDAAVVVGERSFGKGSVQEVHEIGGKRGSADANVKYTVQHYLLPPKPGEAKGRLVHKKPGATDWGVLPDYVVKLSPDQIDEINKIRASADDVPEDAAEDLVESPGASPSPEAGSPEGAGSPKASEPKAPRDPAELISKGIDPQLELAVLLLQGRTLAERDRAAEPSPVAPAAKPAAPAGGRARS
jgi:carboxyl-terminal processing protease